MAKIDEKFIVNLKGKDFVLYEGLLDLAHQKGLISIDVELLQIPNESNGNTAIVEAIAKTEKATFSDIGDASPLSVNSMIKPHIIRMASTRAKARALRDLTNIGMTALEEIMEDDIPTDRANPKQQPKKQTNKKGSGFRCSECSVSINQAVNEYSKKNFGKPLCMKCQKEHRK